MFVYILLSVVGSDLSLSDISIQRYVDVRRADIVEIPFGLSIIYEFTSCSTLFVHIPAWIQIWCPQIGLLLLL
jgi:hypothetical protein